MPVEFRLEPTGSSSDTARLSMMYDGSGRRISKTLLTKSATATSWDTVKVTHYTGIGTEVREEFHNGTREKVNVVVNMPQGLGRYGIEDAADPFKGIPLDENGKPTSWSALNPKFEWFLKNHLGSTMLVYGTVSSTDPNTADIGETKAAYDYRAFGEQVELLPHDLDKVTENFTGKEHDEEIKLNYFGARYLDPMLGLWTSVDPFREFLSSYAYSPADPLNGYDGDGKKWIYVETKKTWSNIFYNILTWIFNVEGDTQGKVTVGGRSDIGIHRTVVHKWKTMPGEQPLYPDGTIRYITQTKQSRQAAEDAYKMKYPNAGNELFASGYFMWSPYVPLADDSEEFGPPEATFEEPGFLEGNVYLEDDVLTSCSIDDGSSCW